MKKTVSVVMATYNGEKYIKEQIDSIINQSYPVTELIIQDDCSKDDTWNIIMDYSLKYPTLIKCYKTQRNLGPHQNFITAFKYAQGDYIAPADQDDFWMKDKIEVLIKTIGDKELCFSQEETLFEDGSVEQSYEYMKPIKKLVWSNNLKGHTFLFKRKLIELYQYSGALSFDYVIALYASVSQSYIHTDTILSVWRRHPGVCTFAVLKESSFKIERLSSSKKTKHGMVSLLKGIKSSAIMQSFNDRSRFIEFLANNDKGLLRVSRLLQNVSKQTFCSYIKAGFIHMLLSVHNEEFSSYSLRNKVGAMIFAFKTPYIYWFDLHQEKSLE